MKTDRFSAQHWFPIMALAISLVNMLLHLGDWHMNIIASIFGMVCFVFHYIDSPRTPALLYFWSAIQVLEITNTKEVMGRYLEKPIFDFGQLDSISFFVSSGRHDSGVSVSVNLIGIVMVFLCRTWTTGNVKGRKVKISSMDKAADIDDLLPLEGEIIAVNKFGDERKWAVVKLDQEAVVNGQPLKHVIIARKDNEHFKNGYDQICLCRLVDESGTYFMKSRNIQDFAFAGWTMVWMK